MRPGAPGRNRDGPLVNYFFLKIFLRGVIPPARLGRGAHRSAFISSESTGSSVNNTTKITKGGPG